MSVGIKAAAKYRRLDKIPKKLKQASYKDCKLYTDMA